MTQVGRSYAHSVCPFQEGQGWELFTSGVGGGATMVQMDVRGRLLAYGRKDNSVEVWDMRTVPVVVCTVAPLPLAVDLMITGACFSQHGDALAVLASKKRPAGTSSSAGSGHKRTDGHLRQVFICSLVTRNDNNNNSNAPSVVAEFSIPFGITQMFFWGAASDALVVAAGEGRKGRFVLSKSLGGCRELLFDSASGQLSPSPAEIGPSDDASATTTTSSSSFCVHKDALFFVENGTLYQYLLLAPFTTPPALVMTYQNIVMSSSAVAAHSTTTHLLPLSDGNAHLLLLTDEQLLQVVSVSSGKGCETIVRFSLQPGASATSFGWLKTSKSESLVLSMWRTDTSNRIVFIDSNSGDSDFVDISRHVSPERVVVCTNMYNTRRPFCVFGIDQRDFCWVYAAKCKSDFPGPMYPVAFQLLKEGTTYTEREDELDLVINGQPVSEIVSKDPLSRLSNDSISIGSSFYFASNRQATTPPDLCFDEQQLAFLNRISVSPPAPQEDVLGAVSGSHRTASSWTMGAGLPSSKRAAHDASSSSTLVVAAAGGVDDSDDALAAGEAFGAGGAIGTLAQFLRPTPRIVSGDFLRKLNAALRSGDEVLRICADESGNTVDPLDHLVPLLPLSHPKTAKPLTAAQKKAAAAAAAAVAAAASQEREDEQEKDQSVDESS